MKPKSSVSARSGLRDAPAVGDTQTVGDNGLDGRFVVEPVSQESQDDPGLFGVGGPVSDIVEDESIEQEEPGRSFS